MSLIEVGLGFQFSEMDSSCGLECSTAYECPCMLRCLYDNMCLHQCVCVCAFMHVRDHIYTISECLPRRRPIRQADRFIRREPGGCRAAAGAKPTEIAWSVCKSARLVTGLGIGSTSSPPYLCHLWLQHQRFRTHPRNVYVDLTATWERMC